MMASVSFVTQVLVVKLLGLFYASCVLFITVLCFIRHPIRFLKETFFTKRPVMPACLNDPSLGNHEFIHLEDVRLHYVAKGDRSKPLMLFLHGFPEFWYSWRYQLREFSRDYRVVAVDQRGYGESDKPSGVDNYIIDKMSKDVKQLIVALGYEKCILVAHDWGGGVAWDFVSKYPEMVEKLVVCNCPSPATMRSYMITHFSQFKKSWYVMFFQIPLLPEFAFKVFDFWILEKFLGECKNTTPSAEDVEAYKYNYSKKGALSPPINWYRASFNRIIVENHKTTVPMSTLIIFGDPDNYLNTELAHLAAKSCPDCQVKIIKDSTHFVIFDKPKEVNAAIRDFLSKK